MLALALHEDFFQAQVWVEVAFYLAAGPVVEVAADDQGVVVGAHGFEVGVQLAELLAAFVAEEAEVQA